MPWSLNKRDGKWCVVKDSDGEVEGCHSSRADAIRQQRALYANESRTASMYAELDEMVEEVVEDLPKMEDHLKGSELVKIVVGNEQDKALTASVVQALEATNERLGYTEQMTASLAAALELLAQPTAPPVINVAPADVKVDVPPAQVTVESPSINYQPPDVHVAAPNVTVNPEIHLPSTRRRVEFTRDILSDKLTGAEIVEE